MRTHAVLVLMPGPPCTWEPKSSMPHESGGVPCFPVIWEMLPKILCPGGGRGKRERVDMVSTATRGRDVKTNQHESVTAGAFVDLPSTKSLEHLRGLTRM